MLTRKKDASQFPTQVVGVVDQLLVVGTDIHDDGKNSPRVKATGRDVQIQLADGDAQSAEAQVTETEDSGGKKEKRNGHKSIVKLEN